MFKGIDVSTFQKDIDWKRVQSDGIQFAMLRSSFGWSGNQIDAYFETNYQKAKEIGMPIGAYHYSYADTVEEAIKEADYCYSVIKGKQFEYPIAFDMEEVDAAKSGKDNVSAIAKAFCKRMESYGYYVCIYANLYWFNNYFTDDVLKKYDVWLAQWSPKYTLTKVPVGIWQYTSSGNVSGISGRTDMNIAYKDYPSIIKNAGLNGFRESTTQPKPPQDDISSKSVDALAREVINGKYGNGEERRRILGSRYDEVQKRVNEILYGTAQPPKTYNKGHELQLNNAPIYASATAKQASGKISGKYYIYDGIKLNGRYRITNSKANVGKNPISQYVTGFIQP